MYVICVRVCVVERGKKGKGEEGRHMQCMKFPGVSCFRDIIVVLALLHDSAGARTAARRSSACPTASLVFPVESGCVCVCVTVPRRPAISVGLPRWSYRSPMPGT